MISSLALRSAARMHARPLARLQRRTFAAPRAYVASTVAALRQPAGLLARAPQRTWSLSRPAAVAGALRFYSDYPDYMPLNMPALSPTMEEGNLLEWKKAEGDEVAAGDVIAEVETDKAVVSWESTEDGFMARLLVPAKSEGVRVGQLVGVMVDSQDDVAAFADFEAPSDGAAAKKEQPKKEQPKKEQPKQEQPKQEQPKKEQPQQDLAKASSGTPRPPTGRVRASPAARAAAEAEGKDLGQIEGSGPGGRVLKSDVERFSTSAEAHQTHQTNQTHQAPAQHEAEGDGFTDVKNSQIRKVVARRLTESKQQVPHYYLTVDCNVDKLMKVRQQLNAQADGYKLSVNDFIVKASALALREVPEANSSWMDTAIRRYHSVHINVAVNTDEGLFTPLVANADRKGLKGISSTVRALADKAHAKALTPADLETGTFTISNLGMFGIKHFAAVINPPQACILAAGGVEDRVVLNADPEAAEKFKVAKFMSVTLSCDHRVVDGAIGARWLQAFKTRLEDPLNMLL